VRPGFKTHAVVTFTGPPVKAFTADGVREAIDWLPPEFSVTVSVSLSVAWSVTSTVLEFICANADSDIAKTAQVRIVLVNDLILSLSSLPLSR
jgi:hypothetical protein